MPEKDEARRSKTDGPVESAKPAISTVPTASAQRTDNARQDIMPVYRALIRDPYCQLLALQLPLDKASEFAGLPDRYLNKALNPDTPSGRQMSWSSLQTFFDLVYPDGYSIQIKSRPGPQLDALSFRYALRYDKAFANPKTRRELLAEWGARGGKRKRELPKGEREKIGRRLARARKRIPPDKRKKLASNASRSRWLRHREAQKKNAGQS